MALKILSLDHPAMDAEEVHKRYRREAQVAAELDHPHTVEQYDYGLIDDEHFYLATELLEGMALDERIERDGGVDRRQLLAVAAAVLDALHAMHIRDIVHRDLKPHNIFLQKRPGPTDFPKIFDFGTAKTLRTGEALTADDTALGTPAYMAPEILAENDPRPVSDLYALGLTLAEAITGARVVTGKTPVMCAQQHLADGPHQLPAELAADPLRAWIETAIRKEPSRRYSSAAEMLYELEQLDVELPREALELSAFDSTESVQKTMQMQAIPAADDAGSDPDGETVALEAIDSPEKLEPGGVDSSQTVPVQAVAGPETDPKTQKIELEEALDETDFPVGEETTTGEQPRSDPTPDTASSGAESPMSDDEAGIAGVILIPGIIIAMVVMGSVVLLAFGVESRLLTFNFWVGLTAFAVLGLVNRYLINNVNN